MKLKKILGNFEIFLIVITIVIFNLIIGGNEKKLPILPMCIILACSFIILLIKKIKYKEKLIKSKIDIAVTIFMTILFLPLIFRTYCSLEGTIEFILKYIFVYAIYLLIRNVVDTKKKYNIIISTVIISSLIIIILGIDIQHANYFNWLIKKLDLYYPTSYRFSSTFGYANAVSIYVLFCVFLCINRIENTQKNIIKAFYFMYILLGTYIIYISYSRVVLILYAVSILVYLGIKVYNKIKYNKSLLKKIIVVTVGCIGMVIIYLVIAIRIPKPYVTNEQFKLRKEIKPNFEYEFDFDANIETTEKNTACPQLVILETNKYFKETEIGRVTLNSENNFYNIKIKTSEDVYYIKFRLINVTDKEIAINHFYINGKEYIFSHKYIPSIISRLITSFSLSDDSIVLRKHFYENCLRISKDSLFIGHGGNTWKNLAVAYADYPYEVKETHSYFFELLICYGIVGVIAFLGILILFCKEIIKDLLSNKEKRKLKLSAFTGLMSIMLYNLLFDFGMSFIVIILIVFAFIALLQFEKNENINLKYIDTSFLIIIGIVFIILLNSCIAKYCISDLKIKSKLAPYVAKYNLKAMDKTNIEDIKKYIQIEPYKNQNSMYRAYWNTLYENRNNYSEEQLKKYIDFGIKTFETKKSVYSIYFDAILERTEIMKDVINQLEEIENTNDSIIRLKEQMKKEYKTNSEYIKDTKRNNSNETEVVNTLNNYKSILEAIDIKTD